MVALPAQEPGEVLSADFADDADGRKEICAISVICGCPPFQIDDDLVAALEERFNFLPMNRGRPNTHNPATNRLIIHEAVNFVPKKFDKACLQSYSPDTEG
jgi:hypothetical protein